MDWTLALSFTFVMAMLALRFQGEKSAAQGKAKPKFRWKDRLDLAHVLLAALIGFAVIGYNLESLRVEVDGKTHHETFVERVIRFLGDRL